MPLTFTNLTSGADTAASSSYTTASITPSANQLLIAFVGVAVNTAPAPEPVLSGNGLTWVRLDGTFAARGVAIYRAMGASPTAGAVTIASPAGETYSLGTWSIVQFNGADTSGTNGSGAIVQTISGNGSGAGGTLTLASAVTSGNATAAVYQVNLDEPMTPRVNWTEIAELRDPTPVTTMASQYRLAGEQTSSADWTNSGAWRGVAIEVKQATATPNTGTVSGTHTWTGTVTGRTVRRGTVTGTVTWTGTVTGSAPVPQGTVTGTHTWTGTVTGTTVRRGTVTGAHTWTGTVTGSNGDQPAPIVVVARTPDPLPVVSVWKHLSGTQWAKVGDISTYDTLSVEPRHLDPGTWSLTMPYDTTALSMRPDRLLTFDWRGQRLMTGAMGTLNHGTDENGTINLTAGGLDTLSILARVLAWPDPAAAITLQPTAGVYTGPAETVLTTIISANVVTRYGAQLAVPASQGRGSTVTARVRFDNILEVARDKAAVGGIGIRVGLVDTSSTRADLSLSFYVPEDKTARVRLSHSAGMLRDWQQSETAPAATRAIVGGDGEGANRVLRSVTTAAAEAAAAEWGGHREVFVDNRAPGTSDVTEIDQSGYEALVEGAEVVSVAATAAEAEGLLAFRDYAPGDKATAELLTGLSMVDVIRAITVTINEGGVDVEPHFGDPDAQHPAMKQAQMIRALRQRVRNLEARR